MTNPTGLDQSFSTADPATAARRGVEVISMYLSWDSSKNITANKIKAYHRFDVASMFNWESQAGAPLLGAKQGKADATQAVKLAKQIIAAVGYKPRNRLNIYFSCDRDVTSANYPAIDAYYRAAKAVCAAAGFGIGVYGEAALVAHLHLAGITDAEWQTYAWSGGVLSPDADFYQYRNGQTLGGASVDFDRVIHAAQLGAWWPPNHTLNAVAGSTGGLMMDPEVKAAFAALTAGQAATNKRLDALPKAVWSVPFVNPNDKKTSYTAASWLVSGNVKAGQALAAATAAGKAAAIDAAAVAADIKTRLLALLGGTK